MVRGVEHTAIFSHHHQALADWYVRTLSFVIAYRGASPQPCDPRPRSR